MTAAAPEIGVSRRGRLVVVQRQRKETPVRVQGKHMTVTDALRQRVEQKVSKLSRHFDHIRDTQVVLSVSRNRAVGRAQGAEVTMWGDGLVLRAEELSQDMYTSIDKAFDKLDRQIAKYRDRIIEKRRLDVSRARLRTRRSAEAALRAGPPPRIEDGAQGDVVAPGLGLDIVRTKRFELKPMPVEEATLQMELLGHTFFVFRNSVTQEVSVVYRRRDGGYGLIEPEG